MCETSIWIHLIPPSALLLLQEIMEWWQREQTVLWRKKIYLELGKQRTAMMMVHVPIHLDSVHLDLNN